MVHQGSSSALSDELSGGYQRSARSVTKGRNPAGEQVSKLLVRVASPQDGEFLERGRRPFMAPSGWS